MNLIQSGKQVKPVIPKNQKTPLKKIMCYEF